MECQYLCIGTGEEKDREEVRVLVLCRLKHYRSRKDGPYSNVTVS